MTTEDGRRTNDPILRVIVVNERGGEAVIVQSITLLAHLTARIGMQARWRRGDRLALACEGGGRYREGRKRHYPLRKTAKSQYS